jgi:hypothetical protein
MKKASDKIKCITQTLLLILLPLYRDSRAAYTHAQEFEETDAYRIYWGLRDKITERT